ncbi:MAG: DNA polymerase III subunit gamma/tau [Nitrolancea sp.]
MALQPSGQSGVPAQSQSLYRKYRPTSFDPNELVGQEHIAKTLQNAIALDRVAHAYLFCGPRGTGKTSTARLLAKAVNCLDPDPAARPCNHCASCDAINSGSAVDIIEIDAASNRGVDDIRDLREKVKYAPTQLWVKFYIIDEAHQLTKDAFNAFLKTLEEPPPHVKFVLATTEPDKLPDTVASRCQRFDFRRIPLESAIGRLRTICDREGLEVEDEALSLIARQSTGSLRDAEGLLDQLALYRDASGSNVVTAEAVRGVLGLSRNERLVELVEALSRRDAGAGLRLIAEAAEGGEDVHQLNRQFVGYLRVLLHIRAGGRDSDADEAARRQAEAFTLQDLVRFTQTFSAIEGTMNKGSFAQLPLEIAFVESVLPPQTAVMTTNEPAPQPERPVYANPDPMRAVPGAGRPSRPSRRDPAGEDRVSEPSPMRSIPPREQPPSSPAETKPEMADGGGAPQVSVSPSSPALEKLVANWTQIRRDVKTANTRIAALLASTDPTAVRDDQIILVSPYEFHRNKLNEDSARRAVEDVIARYMGATFHVVCVDPDDARSQARAGGATIVEHPARNGNGKHIEQPVADPDPFDDPRVRAAKSIFNATELEPRN